MPQEVINIGDLPDDGTGDPVRTAFEAANAKFAELDAHAGNKANPHKVTAAQVDAYSKAETNTIIEAFILEVAAGVVSPQQLAEALSGIVVAVSTTPITLLEGAERILILNEATRAGFAPGTFAVVTRASSIDDYAVIRPSLYDVNTGALTFTVEEAIGAPGPFTDWQIASLAGSTLAQIALLTEGRAARTEAETARDQARDWATKTTGEVATGLGFGAKKYAQDAAATLSTVTTKASEAATSAETATTKAAEAVASAASIAGGPVASVNGKTGIAVLTAADVGAYSTAAVDGKFTALLGGVTAAHDTLIEIETDLAGKATAIAANATAIATKAGAAELALKADKATSVTLDDFRTLAIQLAKLKGSTLGMAGGVADDFKDTSGFVATSTSLLHFEGANGSTTFTDEKGNVITATGSVTISTAWAKFGTSSALFSGGRISGLIGGGVGTGDFCFEGFFNPTSLATAGTLFCRTTTAGGNPLNIRFGKFQSTVSGIEIGRYGINTDKSYNYTFATATSYHIVVERWNGVLTVYVNGVSIGSGPDTYDYGVNDEAYIGQNAVGGEVLAAYGDEIRFSKVARYRGNFAPPATAFDVAIESINASHDAGTNTILNNVIASTEDLAFMTSNSAPAGQSASASSEFGGAPAYMAFDGNASTNASSAGVVTSHSIQRTSTTSRKVARYAITGRNDINGQSPPNISFWGSNNGGTTKLFLIHRQTLPGARPNEKSLRSPPETGGRSRPMVRTFRRRRLSISA